MGEATDTPNAVDRGLSAIDAEDLDAAEDALEEAEKQLGENHVRVLHLSGMIAWARGELERASGFLMQAADMGPDRADIYIDCAECLFTIEDDVAQAEASVRLALALPNVESRQASEARLLLAQIRLADDDAEEALEALEGVAEDLRKHPAYLSIRAAALMAAGDTAGAVALLEKAVESDPEDPDYHYQLGVTRQAAGDHDGACAAMKRVLQLDRVNNGAEPPSYAESQDLRTRLEDVLEDLPDPILRLVANSPITVQQRATEDQIDAGLDPRSIVVFAGSPKRGDADAELAGIVIMRDLLLDDIVEDDDISNALFHALMDEVKFFFQQDIAFAFSEA